MSYQKLSRDQIAKRVAQDIPDGAYVTWVLVYRPRLPAITC
ncbi:hypothetical protein ACIN5162_2164 [Acinetobacter baumannii OIFC0162]|nr:hypothetical protein ACIN5162_2164 [Acinetobacter baumannii OIFC0162]EKU51594.1 hypothetical protein ACINWC348_2164 [Acinetobacter baumannii WC-348]